MNNKRIKKWVQILNDRTIISKDDLRILLSYAAEGGEATCNNLELKYGELANFYSKTALQVKINNNYPELGFPLLSRGKDKEGTRYELDPDLYEALKEIDSSSISLYPAKIIEFIFDEKKEGYDRDELVRCLEEDEVLLVDKADAEQRNLKRFVPGDFALLFVKNQIHAFCQISGRPYEMDENNLGVPVTVLKEYTDEINTSHAIHLRPRGSVIKNSGSMTRADLKSIEKVFGYSLYDLWKYKMAFGSILPITQEEVTESEKEDFIINQKVVKILADDSYETINNYIPVPEPRKNVDSSEKKGAAGTYPREPQKRINALQRAGFKCECNQAHKSFISKTTDKPYMETHHLVPLEFWESFDNSLDVEANIVCLCSNCHNEIHYGKDAKRLIEHLFKRRNDELLQANIIVNLEQLIDMYEGRYTK